jgi:16S rRNA (guanine966-N2)-methyltransferase
MGVEALSRGAASCAFLDTSLAALKLAERNAAACGEGAHARFLLTDATKPPRPERAATLAFLDPPYDSDLAAPALAALSRAGWLAPGALIVVETGSRGFAPPAGFATLDARRYGRARVEFLRHAP